MKRIIRLTESDLVRIVKRVINEDATAIGMSSVAIGNMGSLDASSYGPGEKVAGNGFAYVFENASNPGQITSVTVKVTPEGAKLGLTNANLVFTQTAKGSFTKSAVSKKRDTTGNIADASPIRIPFTFTAPSKPYMNNTGKWLKLYDVTVATNDGTKPIQTSGFGMQPNVQFGVGAASGQ